MPPDEPIVPLEIIERTIFAIRGQKIMLDFDLARLYGVTTGQLNQQVKRNRDRLAPRLTAPRMRRSMVS